MALGLKRIQSCLQQIVTEGAELEKILALPDGRTFSGRSKIKSHNLEFYPAGCSDTAAYL